MYQTERPLPGTVPSLPPPLPLVLICRRGVCVDWGRECEDASVASGAGRWHSLDGFQVWELWRELAGGRESVLKGRVRFSSARVSPCP